MTCILITMKLINEVVNGGVTILFFVVTHVPKKRNLSIFRGLKGAWKYIRTLEWKWKRDVAPLDLALLPFFFHNIESGSSPTRIE